MSINLFDVKAHIYTYIYNTTALYSRLQSILKNIDTNSVIANIKLFFCLDIVLYNIHEIRLLIYIEVMGLMIFAYYRLVSYRE